MSLSTKLSLAVVLAVMALLIHIFINSGEYKHVLVALSIAGTLFACLVGIYFLFKHLRIAFQPTERHFNTLVLGTIMAFGIGGVMAYAAALTAGYKPWLLYVIGSIFVIGLGFTAAMCACRGLINRKGVVMNVPQGT